MKTMPKNPPPPLLDSEMPEAERVVGMSDVFRDPETPPVLRGLVPFRNLGEAISATRALHQHRRKHGPFKSPQLEGLLQLNPLHKLPE